MAIMAMFPLGSVLFPGAPLPLHVFEDRYRTLVQDCLADEAHEFGVALIDRGFEVGGGDTRSFVGTVAQMVQVAELADGRYALMTIGTRRIRINAWLPDDPYPLADVEDWPDDDSALSADDQAALVATVFGQVRRINALASELGGSAVDVMAEISDDPLMATYHLSNLAPVGPADRQRLLEAPGPDQRLAILTDAVDDVEALLRFRLQHPSNGTGDELDEFGES